MKIRDLFRNISIIILLCFTSITAYAGTIKIGQSLPITGSKSDAAIAFQRGCQAWIKYVNKNGGVNGDTIELLTLDDNGSPELAQKNTKELISKNVYLLFGYMGHDSCIKSADIAKKSNIPFFGASTGAPDIHNFTDEYIFTIRPGYYDEVKNIISLLHENNENKISILYTKNRWGESFLKASQWCFDEKNEKFNKLGIDHNNPDIVTAVDTIVKDNPDAVIVGADADIAISFIKILRTKNPAVKIITISDTDGDKLSKQLMNYGVGVVVSQVVPFPYYKRIPVVGHYNKLTQQYFPNQKVSFYGLEGFICAKALTTIISELGDNRSRENFIQTAIDLRPVNLGGFIFDFTKKDHTGSKISFLTQIAPGGFLSPIRSINDIYKYSPF